MFEGPFDFVFTMVHRGIFAAVGSLFVTFGLSAAGVNVIPSEPAYEPIPEALVAERMQAEQEEAHSLGFSGSVEPISIAGPATVASIELSPDTCVAVVAGAWGSHRIMALALLPSGTERSTLSVRRPEALSADPEVEGLVASTQFCTTRARSLDVEVRSTELAPMEPAASFHGLLTLQRAPATDVGGASALRRGWLLLGEARPGANAGAGRASSVDAGADASAPQDAEP